MLRKLTMSVALSALVACQTTTYSHDTAVTRAEDALGLTIVAQMMIVGGAAPLALLPLLIATDLHATNLAMLEAQSHATIEDTYRFVYNRDLSTVDNSGNTGVVFRDLKSATRHFRSVLAGHGVAHPEDFLLTAVRTADSRGYTLYALVHRPQRSVRVRMDDGRIRTFTEKDPEFYLPYRTGADGRTLDVVIDWAGVPRSQISTQKGQAILLTLAANSVLKNSRSDEYWGIQSRWLAGNYREIVSNRTAEIKRRIQ